MMVLTIESIHFLKALGPRISKLILPSVSYTNTQIQIHKCTNTHIQHMTKCQKDPTCGIFLDALASLELDMTLRGSTIFREI